MGRSSKVGRLTVIAGSMFSGKSTELLRQGRRHTQAGKQGFYVKPQVDDRYAIGEIVTHDHDRMDCYTVPYSYRIIETLNALPAAKVPHVVLIDEAQFFDEALPEVLEKLLRAGIDVYAAGLDIDRHGRPFGPMPYLLAVANDVLKLHAVCPECGEDAYVSYGAFEADGQVVVGGAEKYKPLCRSCFYAKEAGDGSR